MLLADNIQAFMQDRCARTNCFKLLQACPLCDGRRLRLLFSRWGFDHLECQSCDLVFVAQEPSRDFLDDMYENLDYYKLWTSLVEKPGLEKGASFNYAMNVDDWYRYLVDEILRWQSAGRWLDVGGGTGRLLRFVKGYAPQFETVLCETNSLACELAERYCDAKTISWQELNRQEGTFNVISLIAVFEHVPDSVEFVKQLGKLLAPGGVLYMAMPRLGPLSRRVSRTVLYDIAPPMHLRFFSDRALRCLERLLEGEMHLRLLRQSHGKRFHVGHLFRPEWYQLMDLVPEYEGDLRRRVVLAPPSTPWEQFIFRALARIDAWLAPMSAWIDGQRMLHALWQRPG